MTWNAHIRRQHRSGISVAELCAVAARALAASHSEATRCPKRPDAPLASPAVAIDGPGRR